MPLDGHGVHLGGRPRQARRSSSRSSAWRELGFELVATEGTAEILRATASGSRVVSKYSATQGAGEPNIVDLINAGEIDIVVNTPSGRRRARRRLRDPRGGGGRRQGPVHDDGRARCRRQRADGARARASTSRSLQEYAAAMRAARAVTAVPRSGCRAAVAELRAAVRRHRPARAPARRSGGWRTSAAGLREFGLRVVDAAAGACRRSSSRRSRSSSATAPPGSRRWRRCWPRRGRRDSLVIADAKRGDIGSTMDAYADAFLRDRLARWRPTR